MSSHVQMVKNTLSGRFITFDGSSIVSSLNRSDADNFVIEDTGVNRFLRPYNSALDRLHRTPSSLCQQGLTTSSTGSIIHTSPSGTNFGVRVFIIDSATGEKWYLRVNVITRNVSLECQSALDNATGIKKREFEFDIIAVSTSEL